MKVTFDCTLQIKSEKKFFQISWDSNIPETRELVIKQIEKEIKQLEEQPTICI